MRWPKIIITILLLLTVISVSPSIEAASEVIGVNLVVNNFLNDSTAKALSWVVFNGSKSPQSQVDNVIFDWYDPNGSLAYKEIVDPDVEAVAWSHYHVDQLGEWSVNVTYQGNSSIFNNKSFDVISDHWGPGDYHVTRTTLVSFNATLTIEPGTTVKFDEGKGLGVEGKLIAQGTESNPIILTSNLSSKSPGDWSSITFFESADNLSVLDHVKIEYSREGLTLKGTSPLVINSTFINNKERAIHAELSQSLIINNHISRGDEGISPWGIYSAGSNLTLEKNVIRNMSIGLYLLSSNNTVNASIVMQGNEVENSTYYGMFAKNSIINSTNDKFVGNNKGVTIENKTKAIFEKLTITGGLEGFTASDESLASIWNSTIEEVEIATFILSDDSVVNLIDSSFGTIDLNPGVSINPMDGSILIIQNFLTIETKSFDNGSSLSNATVKVYDGTKLTYQVNTDINGFTPLLLVTDRVYMPVLIENITKVYVTLGNLSFQDNNRSVVMDMSHTEIFLGSIYDFTETDMVPPFVVSHYPIDNEVPVNIMITIGFSEAMQNITVEENFTISPFVTGTFTWAGNIFIFIPQGLANNTLYTVTMKSGARDLANNSMASPYQFSFTTTNITDTTPPRVIEKYPIGIDVAVNISFINITFTEEMNKFSTEASFSINPRIPGIFSWQGNTLRFRLIFELSEMTWYTVTINGSRASDTVGITLDGNANGIAEGSPMDDYVWQFKTKRCDFTPPVIQNVYPTGNMVGTNSLIKIYFSEGMNKTSVEQAFSYTNGTITWTSANGTWGASTYIMTFIPSEPFNYSQLYTVAIKASAKDWHNNTLDGNGNGAAEGSPTDDYTWSFKTIYDIDIGLPTINDVSPLGTGIAIDSEITINFSQIMNQGSVGEAFTITDGVTTWDKSSGTFVWEDNRTFFIPSFTFDYNTTYTVRINITARNIVTYQLDGNKNGIPEDYTIDAFTFNFTTFAPIELILLDIQVNGNDASDPSITWYHGPGEIVVITAKAKNTGFNTTASSFLLSLYNITGPMGGKKPSDMAFNYTINALVQGEESGNTIWNWEAPLMSGDFYINISVDYGNDILELVEENNSFTLHFAVVPDLTITNVTIDGLPISAYPDGVIAYPGQILSIGSNTLNIGQSSTGILEFNMSFWNCSDTGVNFGSVLYDVGPFGWLDAGNSTPTQYILWQAPISTIAEDYYINISTDGVNDVSEKYEDNNFYILHIKVDAPDLAPDFIELKVAGSGTVLETYADPIGKDLKSSTIFLPLNVNLDIIFDTINLGGVNQSLGTNVILYNTSDLHGEPVGMPFFGTSQEFVNLSAFGMPNDQTCEAGQTVMATWVNPGVAGMYYINISIDPGNKVIELNESNNIFVLVINVSLFRITTIKAIGPVYYGVEWYLNSSTQLNFTNISGTPPIYTYYRILNHNSGAVLQDWTNYTGNTSFMLTLGEGTFRIEYYSTDAIFTEQTISRVVILDNSPPYTTIDFGQPKYRAIMSDVLNISAETPIIFFAIDNPSGENIDGVKNASGIYSPTKPESGIFYRIWSVELGAYVTSWQKYMPGVPIYLSNASWAEGLYEIHYNATDNLGNNESMNTSLVYLDKTGPMINVEVSAPNWTGGGVRVNVSSLTLFTLLSKEEIGAGPKSTFYRIFDEDNSIYLMNWIESMSFTLSSILLDGNYTIECYATDNVLNIGALDLLRVFLDNSPPESFLNVGESKYRLRYTDDWTVSGNTFFTLQGEDGIGSEIYGIYYSIWNESGGLVVSSNLYAGPFNLSGLGEDGQYTIRYWAKDNVNNTEIWNKIIVILDTTYPNIIFKAPTGTGNSITSYIQIIFSEEMDHDSVKNAFSYTDGIEIWDYRHGFINWNRKIMTFYPYEKLYYSTYYTVILNTTASDNVGNRLDGDADGIYEGMEDIYNWYFWTIEEPDNDPPIVVSVYPSEDAHDVAIDDVIVIEFSETMNEIGVEQAFSYSDGERTFNSDDGVFIWVGNKTTFIPLEPLDYGTEYTVSISTLARDLSGNTMITTFTWRFTTKTDSYPPNIMAISPSGENVPIDTVINVSFSEPMDKNSVQKAFIIIPSVNGSFAWMENTLIFTPAAVLEYGTIYYVYLGIETKDITGNALGLPYQFSFTTEPDTYPPYVVSYYPSGVEVDINVNVTITFNEAMDHLSVEDSFSIEPYVGGNLSWIDNTLIFTPLILINDTTYTVTIGEEAKDTAGNSLSFQYQFSFTTKKDPYPPFIVEVEPIGVDVPIDSIITVRFNEAMNLSSFYSAFRIEPYVAGTLSWENDTLIFRPNAKFAKSTVYNVTILNIASDLAGNPMVENYTWQFETEAIKPAQTTPFPWDLFFFWLIILIVAVFLVLMYYEYVYKRRKRREEEGEIEVKMEKEPQEELEEEPKEELEWEEKPIEDLEEGGELDEEEEPEEELEEEEEEYEEVKEGEEEGEEEEPEEEMEEELEGELEEELEEKMEEDPLEELEELPEEE